MFTPVRVNRAALMAVAVEADGKLRNITCCPEEMQTQRRGDICTVEGGGKMKSLKQMKSWNMESTLQAARVQCPCALQSAPRRAFSRCWSGASLLFHLPVYTEGGHLRLEPRIPKDTSYSVNPATVWPCALNWRTDWMSEWSEGDNVVMMWDATASMSLHSFRNECKSSCGSPEASVLWQLSAS